MQNTNKIGPNRGLGRPKHTGWLQRRVFRCFIASDGPVRGSEMAEWCWPRLRALERKHRKNMARAARSIGAIRVGRDGRVWIWRLSR